VGPVDFGAANREGESRVGAHRPTTPFDSFSELCDDIVDARVWSGIHFRFADEEAAKIGRKVAHFGNRRAFR
jgi:hypothetical protein